jgi:WD40 repeat protein
MAQPGIGSFVGTSQRDVPIAFVGEIMRKITAQIVLICLLVACSQVSPATTTASTETALPFTSTFSSTPMLIKMFPSPTGTFTSSPTDTPTNAPTATITPPSIEPVSLNPLALNEWNVTQIKRLATYGTGEPEEIAWSPDGNLFAVATTRGVWLYEGTTLSDMGFVDVNDTVSAMAFSPDGQILAVAVHGQVGLWNVQTKQKMRDIEGPQIWIDKLAYGKGGQIAALGVTRWIDTIDMNMILWDATTGERIFFEDHIGYNTEALIFSSDGKTLAFVGGAGITIMEARTGKIIESKDSPAYSVAFNQDGTRLFMVTWGNGKDMVWDLSRDIISPWDTCEFPMAAGNHTLLCGSGGGKAALIDLADEHTIRKLDVNVTSHLALRPDGRLLATIDLEKNVKIFDTTDSGLIKTIPFTDLFTDFSGEDLPLALGMARLNEESKYLAATANPAGDIQVWNIETGEVELTLQTGSQIAGLALSPDQRTLASMDHKGVLTLWDLQNAEIVYSLDLTELFSSEGQGGPIAFSPDGLQLAIAGDHDVTFILDLQSSKNKRLGATHLATGTRSEFLFLADNHLLQLVTNNDAFALGDAISDNIILPLPNLHHIWWSEDTSELDAATIDSTGRYFVLGTYDGIIQVWDIDAQKQIINFAGHPAITDNAYTYSIFKLGFSPQSHLLVSVGWDGTTRLWNSITGAERGKLNVCCFADFTPDGRYLVTAGDGVLRVWGIPSQ